MNKFKVGDQVKYRHKDRASAPASYKDAIFTIRCIHERNGYYIGTYDDGMTEGGQDCQMHGTRWIANEEELELVEKNSHQIRRIGSKQLILKQ